MYEKIWLRRRYEKNPILNTSAGKRRLEGSTFKMRQNKSQMTPYGNIDIFWKHTKMTPAVYQGNLQVRGSVEQKMWEVQAIASTEYSRKTYLYTNYNYWISIINTHN